MYRRRRERPIQLCVICGEVAKGVNFNALTCMSCKAFFRRNANSKKEMLCPFGDTCHIDKITRKFCAKCRLQKCFDAGMKKEWILNEEERREMNEKIAQNRLDKQNKILEQAALYQKRLLEQQEPMVTATIVPKPMEPIISLLESRLCQPLIASISTPSSTIHSSQSISNATLFTLDPIFQNESINPKSFESNSIFPPANSTFSSESPKNSPNPETIVEKIFEEPSTFTLENLLSENVDLFEVPQKCSSNSESNIISAIQESPISSPKLIETQIPKQNHNINAGNSDFQTISMSEINELMTLNVDTLEDYCDNLLTNLNNGSIIDKLLDNENINHDQDQSLKPMEQNHISNYLVNATTNDIHNFDPLIENLAQITCKNSITRNLSAFTRELIQPELCLLKELTDACALLQNPYRRMVPQYACDYVRWSRMPQYFFHRLIRMTKRLHRFAQFKSKEQTRLLKRRLVEMFCIRSVLMYDSDREAWGLVDDIGKANVLVQMEMIKPFCSEQSYQRHKRLPTMFRDEWKRDNIIFDLLTLIILFTPRPEDRDNPAFDRIQEEHSRYTNLLRRYLKVKYPTMDETMECFNQLLHNIEEMRHINEDIFKFFRSYSHMLHDCPFFIELLNLEDLKRSDTLTTSIECVPMDNNSPQMYYDVLKYI